MPDRVTARLPQAAGGCEAQIDGIELWLLPEKAGWLPDQRTLLVADAHIGKAQTFRRFGVPVPHGTTGETLGRLSSLVARWQPARIVFLGDLLHSAHARTPATLAALASWRTLHAGVHLTLVRGNHDDHAGDPPAALGFEVVDEPLPLGRLLLCHHPRERAGGYVLAGHLHPCVSLRGAARDSVRLPCFWLGDRVGVLPAFGAFTGMHPVRPAANERVFVVGDGRVLAVPA